MNPISWFVVVSTGATGALLFAMGSRSVGLIVCAVAIGLHRWFRMVRFQAKDRTLPPVDEQHGDADPRQPATLAVLQRTTSSAAYQAGA